MFVNIERYELLALIAAPLVDRTITDGSAIRRALEDANKLLHAAQEFQGDLNAQTTATLEALAEKYARPLER